MKLEELSQIQSSTFHRDATVTELAEWWLDVVARHRVRASTLGTLSTLSGDCRSRRRARPDTVWSGQELFRSDRQPVDPRVGEHGLSQTTLSKLTGVPKPLLSSTSHEVRDIIQFVDRTSTPSLLPIFRSQQQAELLALILGDPVTEHSLVQIAERTGIPYASVHREVERAEAAGLVASRLVGRTRLIRADEASPYFNGLSDVLVKAFGVPWVLGQALTGVTGIDAAYVYGSWAARFSGEAGNRPVGDIDLLVLGGPDRDEVYAAVGAAEQRLGRAVQVTIRAADWLTDGTGTFHDTVAGRPMVSVPLTATRTDPEDRPPTVARPPRRRSAPSTAPTPSRRR